MRLTATNVGKKIKGKTVLSNIDLDLKSGNIYGFVGPNGSGKTMLFRALSGLMSVTSGVVKLDEKIFQCCPIWAYFWRMSHFIRI